MHKQNLHQSDTMLLQLGPPTILINCAAASIHPSPLLSLPPASISSTLTTNLFSHYHTIQTFLPSLLHSPTGGHIVTLSSILAHLPPATLSAYASSKAALSALHTALTAELRPHRLNIKTLLVETGQMATGLFAGVATPNAFFAPVLDRREGAKESVQRINAGEGGIVRMPEYARWVDWYGVLPAGVQSLLRWISGIDEAAKPMDSAANEKQQDKNKDVDGVVVNGEDVLVKEIRS